MQIFKLAEFNAARGHKMEKYIDELKEIEKRLKEERKALKRPASGGLNAEACKSKAFRRF